ncbi:MAG TPA: GlsB/YeaQ/YmgE family stress response membrane protein [Pyrinomonadaceae bacterium]|jgi:uncharacterized membrane protein YeaQ/YmgE (transglycosylase-associated protein family)|nr:GlsB/YeaQ/YmgE family stress response membrane protein [Pyrinomonadaceae bacterium]
MSSFDLTTLGMLITDLQLGSVMSFFAWIVIGAVVGFIVSKIMNKTGHGLVRDILLGILGAIVGGFLANLLGESHTASLDSYSLVVAAVGALVFLITYQGMFRRRRSSRWADDDRRNGPIERREESSDTTS